MGREPGGLSVDSYRSPQTLVTSSGVGGGTSRGYFLREVTVSNSLSLPLSFLPLGLHPHLLRRSGPRLTEGSGPERFAKYSQPRRPAGRASGRAGSWVSARGSAAGCSSEAASEASTGVCSSPPSPSPSSRGFALPARGTRRGRL